MRFHIKSLLAIFLMTSCEDVINIPVQTAPNRLTVEASLDWEKGTPGNKQVIKLSTSTAFFDTTANTVVTGALVSVTNDSNGTVINFVDQNNGEYFTSNFEPIIGQSYTLEIVYNGETYKASDTLYPVPEITSVFQARDDGFNEDELEVHIVFTDSITEGDNYLIKFKKRGELLPELEAANDEFINGNEVDWWYETDDDDTTDEIEYFQPGDTVDFEFYAISEAYYNYIGILISQIGGVGLFESVPVAVKGNCININNPDNFAYGYFRVTEVNKDSYTFVED